MTPTAILLLLISASIHASWNFLSKRSRATIAFFLLALGASVIFFSPVLWLYHPLLPHLPGSVWFFLLLTAGFQALYYFGLAGAYRRGELSVIYPLVRALPVLMVAGVSWVLGRGEQITKLGFIGMLLVASGCMVLPMRSFFPASSPSPPSRPALNPALLLAFLAAIGTTGYTTIDDHALAILRQTPAFSQSGVPVTILYTFLEGISITVWLAVLVSIIPSERRELTSLRRSSWLQPALAGIFMLLSYGLVLVAMAFVRDVSYVSAFRQTSIPIGALMGLLIDKEKAYLPKLVGILLISLGLALVALG